MIRSKVSRALKNSKRSSDSSSDSKRFLSWDPSYFVNKLLTRKYKNDFAPGPPICKIFEKLFFIPPEVKIPSFGQFLPSWVAKSRSKRTFFGRCWSIRQKWTRMVSRTGDRSVLWRSISGSSRLSLLWLLSYSWACYFRPRVIWLHSADNTVIALVFLLTRG